MNTSEIISIVQSIGFPIVMCGAMGYFVYYMYNKNSEQIEMMNTQHREETKELQKAIDNNTIALTQVIDVINSLYSKKGE